MLEREVECANVCGFCSTRCVSTPLTPSPSEEFNHSRLLAKAPVTTPLPKQSGLTHTHTHTYITYVFTFTFPLTSIPSWICFHLFVSLLLLSHCFYRPIFFFFYFIPHLSQPFEFSIKQTCRHGYLYFRVLES